MARKTRFKYSDLRTHAVGAVDPRGYKGYADVPVHFTSVELKVRIKTRESEERLQRLIDLVSRYCPVNSLIRAAVSDYNVTWERMPMEPE